MWETQFKELCGLLQTAISWGGLPVARHFAN